MLSRHDPLMIFSQWSSTEEKHGISSSQKDDIQSGKKILPEIRASSLTCNQRLSQVLHHSAVSPTIWDWL